MWSHVGKFFGFEFVSGCYGVSDLPSDGQWKCQRCLQEDQKAIESSVSRTVSAWENTTVWSFTAKAAKCEFTEFLMVDCNILFRSFAHYVD